MKILERIVQILLLPERWFGKKNAMIGCIVFLWLIMAGVMGFYHYNKVTTTYDKLPEKAPPVKSEPVAVPVRDNNPGNPANVLRINLEAIPETWATVIDRRHKIVRYGSVLFYFPYTGADLGNEFHKFTERHPELEFVGSFHDVVPTGFHGPKYDNNSVSHQDMSNTYGITTGHFMLFEKIAAGKK